MSLFVAHTLPKFETWAKLIARRATTACAARTFAKVNPLRWFTRRSLDFV